MDKTAKILHDYEQELHLLPEGPEKSFKLTALLYLQERLVEEESPTIEAPTTPQPRPQTVNETTPADDTQPLPLNS